MCLCVNVCVCVPQGVCNPVMLLEEPSAIVQLDYSQRVLLVSTYHRSLLFYTQDQTMQPLGTKPRKRYLTAYMPLCAVTVRTIGVVPAVSTPLVSL